MNHAIDVEFRFFRDTRGNEVNLVLDFGARVVAIEIKSSETLKTDFAKGLDLFHRLFGTREGYVVYGGKTPVGEVIVLARQLIHLIPASHTSSLKSRPDDL